MLPLNLLCNVHAASSFHDVFKQDCSPPEAVPGSHLQHGVEDLLTRVHRVPRPQHHGAARERVPQAAGPGAALWCNSPGVRV
jgi:hypothetical protein